jgi:rSAM/selenodomain-associated transferase 1
MKNQDTCVLLFVKNPEKGKVKLRLSAGLNEERVQELYRCFVQDSIATVKKIQTSLFICFYPPEAEKKFKDWLGSTFSFLPQEGSDLGERMKNCFIQAFTQGFQRVILIGSDSPDIPRVFLHNAFAELQTHDVVLGPSTDGGYYLIGFQDTTFLPAVFEGIHWSSPTVLQETVEKIHHEKKHHLSLLPVWSDIDTIGDLRSLMRRNRDTAFKSSQTITYLHRHKILTEDEDVPSAKK